MPPYNRKHYKQRRPIAVVDNVGGSASKRYDCSEGNGFTQKIIKRRGENGKEPRDFTTENTEGTERKRRVTPCLDDVGLIT